mmetsp:Transcript_26875/g.73921  ORF Transcript_26875/g.73921 Transcript_26875/m.73921 type:complete len:375 (-) Transcript_26875:644-1768(-)
MDGAPPVPSPLHTCTRSGTASTSSWESSESSESRVLALSFPLSFSFFSFSFLSFSPLRRLRRRRACRSLSDSLRTAFSDSDTGLLGSAPHSKRVPLQPYPFATSPPGSPPARPLVAASSASAALAGVLLVAPAAVSSGARCNSSMRCSNLSISSLEAASFDWQASRLRRATSASARASDRRRSSHRKRPRASASVSWRRCTSTCGGRSPGESSFVASGLAAFGDATTSAARATCASRSSSSTRCSWSLRREAARNASSLRCSPAFAAAIATVGSRWSAASFTHCSKLGCRSLAGFSWRKSPHQRRVFKRSAANCAVNWSRSCWSALIASCASRTASVAIAESSDGLPHQAASSESAMWNAAAPRRTRPRAWPRR